MAGTPPLVFSSTGPVATPPATLQQALLALVATMAPGYTAQLPGSLIEDISSTDVGALVTIDQARVDAINSVSPYAANPYILAQLGAMFGVPQGTSANGNAYVVFTGTPGYVIPPGFLVSDGTNQYAIQDGGTVASGGTTLPLYVVATNPGTFPIPAGSITTVVTSVPSPYTLTVNNALAGVPATTTETVEAYRARILQAYQTSFMGTPQLLRTLLLMLPGVSSRLVSIVQQGGLWEVIVGGGDPYRIAGQIYQAVPNLGLTGSQVNPDRNVVVSLFDSPDTYTVTFVNPAQQDVTVAVTWNTTLANFTAGATVDQYIISAVASYLNSIVVGQPINLLVMDEQVQLAVAPVLAVANLTTLEYAVAIGGVPAQPTAGTSIIPSDPEGYFFASPTSVTSAQG